MIPREALRYIRNKKLAPRFSYKDIWNEEHATNFTVAKAMQLDVLKDIKDAVEEAFIYPEVMGSDHCPVGIKINIAGTGNG